MIAGRATIAARIYRGFCINSNGFLRGVRSALFPEMPAFPGYFAIISVEKSSLGALETVPRHSCQAISPQHRDLADISAG
jgi:hypothetical protein